MRLLLLSLLITISTAWGQQNTISFTLSGNFGVDQTIIQFDSNASSDFETGGNDAEKVFPSNQNASTIFTYGDEPVFYTVNSMNVSSIADTIIPVFINTPVAGNYTLNVASLTSLDHNVEAYIINVSTLDTIPFTGNESLSFARNSDTDFDPQNPDFLFVIGMQYDLSLIEIDAVNSSCLNSSNGGINVTSNIPNASYTLFKANSSFMNTGSLISGIIRF